MSNALVLSDNNHLVLEPKDRLHNLLITGLPRTGKTTFFIDLILQDIAHHKPLILFDPYGDISEHVIQNTPEEHLGEIAHIDIGNSDYPIGINLFSKDYENENHVIIQSFIELLYDMYDPNKTGIIGPRFEHAIRNAMLTIMYEKNPTLIDLVRCLIDKAYLEKLLPAVTDSIIKNYWQKQIAQTTDFHKSEILEHVVSKLSPFVTDKKIRNIVGQKKSTFDFSQLIGEEKIILLNFGIFSHVPDTLKAIGGIALLQLLSFARKRCGLKNKEIAIYIDEATMWPASPLIDLLRNSRRSALQITVATNRLSETKEQLQNELFRIGSFISFRVATSDAKILVPEFHSHLTVDDLCMLHAYTAYVRLMHQDNPQPAQLINIHRFIDKSVRGKDIEFVKIHSQMNYGRKREEVEQEIEENLR